MTADDDPEAGRTLTLPELATFHRLHPEEREIITEGNTDAWLIRWFVESLNFDVPVYTVKGRLTVDTGFVLSLGEPDGERGRLIAAAKHMESETGFDIDSVSFVIDGDYSYTLSAPPPVAPCLLITDYSCMESYCLEPKLLKKYLAVVLRSDEVDASEAIRAISGLLADFFAIRWLLHRLPGSPTIIAKISNKLSLTDGVITIDVESLLRGSVSKSKEMEVKSLTKEELGRFFEEARKVLTLEARYCMNGHDLGPCLNWYLTLAFKGFFASKERKGFANAEVAVRAWMACLDTGYLLTTNLFGELYRRAKKGSTALS